MRLFRLLGLVAAAIASAGNASAQHAHESKYAGQQTRETKSLSAEDVDELRRGGGWGLARAAELNGVPGPAHLLELKDAIGLSADQVARISALRDAMRTRAIAEGERLIALERRLEAMFRDGTVTDAGLRTALAEIADSRETLRYIHLSTHLETPAILSAPQIAAYNALRGYTDDRCGNAPSGHDPARWRKHSGCE
jgi:hypothetical protein